MSFAGKKSADINSDKDDVAVYIDNSNLWIEGKKAYARKNRMRTIEDPRWRLKLDVLVDITIASRNRLDAVLYGSTPPPTPHLWERLRESVRVETVERCKWTGKEKQVDSMMVADAMECLCEYRDCTVVLVTGDGDFTPILKKFKLPKYQSARAEVWSWRHCIAKSLKEECESHSGRVTIHYLDDYLEKIGFVEDQWKFAMRDIPSHLTLVVLNVINHETAMNARDFIESVSVPVSFNLVNDCDLIIVVGCAVNVNDLDEIIVEARTFVGEENVVSFVEWRQKQGFLDSDVSEVECTNAFDILNMKAKVADDTLNESSFLHDDDSQLKDEGDWTPVVAKKSQNEKDRRKAIGGLCAFGKYCPKYPCGRGHTKADKAHFVMTGNKPKTKIRAVECAIQNCPQVGCNYLHLNLGQKRLCLFCDTHPEVEHAFGRCPEMLKMLKE